MKIKLSLIPLCLLSMCLFLAGCGPSGGETGDANDPAEAGDDMEQMEEETGEV